MTNPSIFKSYDVRGIYPSELNEEAAFSVGRAFLKKTGAKNIVIGHDGRNSSPALFKALTEGLWAQDVTITSIGQTPTEGLYFALAKYDFDGGIMITASHNPKDYNGFKMLVRRNFSEGGMVNIDMVRGKELSGIVNSPRGINGELTISNSSVKIPALDIWPEYVKFISQFSGTVKPFKIAVDASNGVIGKVIEKLKETLPIEIISLNFEVDGNFPNHSPNPLEKGASDQIASTIKKEKADFGFMFDADADRIFLIDELGQQVSADIVLLLLAKQFLAKSPGKGIAYNLICSKSVPEFVTKWGGVPIRTQVGFVNVREGLIKNDGIMGGELSAHYCFRDYFYMDSGIIAFLTLLQIISKENKPVSQIVKELSIYAPPMQANFTINDIPGTLEKVKQTYADGKQDCLDGVTVEYADWWFNLRASNTEPVIKLTIEANTEKILEQKFEELSKLVEK